MKESTLIEMKNKIETLGSLVQRLLGDICRAPAGALQISFGNSKVIKNMPDYEEAIEKLKEESAGELSGEPKAVSD